MDKGIGSYPPPSIATLTCKLSIMRAFETFLATALIFARLGAATWPPISGNDFEFTATYESGLKIIQSKPPKDVLSVEEFLFDYPEIVLTDPDSAGRDGRYTAFLEISYVPYYESLDTVIYTFPWIKTNLIVKENGTLSDELRESRTWSRYYETTTSEVRNATMHVWKENPELKHFIEEDDMPMFFQLARVWSNSTSKVDYNFPRANVDFKVRNETGEFRGDVDKNGAKIEGYVSTSSTIASTAPTDAPSATTGPGSAPASTTTDAGEPTENPNAAGSHLVPASRLLAVSGALLLTSVISAI
ncbi:hypothetical protein F5Y11DRAFT_324084 [Daldinia sp. FL1419]|nr:hypothetical protein F5Y11DRAFT_324084 [Daldinia sp. FL1419]